MSVLTVFGTRAAVLDTSKATDGEMVVRLSEDSGSAEGRFVYLRSFESNRRLAIDGLKIFQAPSGRRLLDAPAPKPAPEAPEPPPKPTGTRPPKSNLSWRRVYLMRNVTLSSCLNESVDPYAAQEARQAGAMLWAELTETESAIACTSCLTQAPVNCTEWFALPHGHRFADTHGQAEKRRELREARPSPCYACM